MSFLLEEEREGERRRALRNAPASLIPPHPLPSRPFLLQAERPSTISPGSTRQVLSRLSAF